MNIDQMQQAGREMDALIAEKVMDWRIHRRNTAWWVKAEEENENTLSIMAWACGKDRWSPSEDIAAAYKMEGKIKEMGYEIQADYVTELRLITGTRWDFDLIHATPAQRCRAALKALGVSS